MSTYSELEKSKLVGLLDKCTMRTLATSATTHNTSAHSMVGTTIYPLDDILQFERLTLIDELSKEEWIRFCGNITTSLDTSKSEAKGIHPTVLEIVMQCNELSGNYFEILYEKNFEDMEGISKRPDISVVSKDFNIDTACMEHVIVAIEIKEDDDLRSAITQSLGYLVCKLRNLLAIYGFDVKLSGLCIGIDGTKLAVGYAVIEKCNLSLYCTGMDGIELWSTKFVPGNSETYPESETMGIRILRSLLSCQTPQQLAHATHVPPVLARRFTLTGVIGKGAFCTAFLASHENTELVIKKTNLNQLRDEPICQLQKECEYLHRFTTTKSLHLPSLYLADWTVTEELPFIPLLPVAQPLVGRLEDIAARRRMTEAKKLFDDVCTGLLVAHNLNICHRDIRPDNVVYNYINNHYVIIDWGLADVPDTVMHEHTGGRPFWDDVMVLRWPAERVAYKEAYDISAARYVAWTFWKATSKRMRTPWSEFGKEALIKMRNSEVGSFPN